MATSAPARDEFGNTGYEIFVGALSVLSLVNIALLAVVEDVALNNVVRTIDVLLSVIFLLDFSVRLARAPSRADYFLRRYGWADLLASLPFPELKILRAFRLVRVIRVLRRNGGRRIVRTLIRDRAGSALLSLLFVGIMVLQFGSLAMIRIELGAPDANIKTASDALWYVIATMSTVGYGDRYPVTNGGRELGTLIIVIGVGIFGTLTGYLANLFLAPREKAVAEPSPDDARRRLTELQELVARQQAALAELDLALRRPGWHRGP